MAVQPAAFMSYARIDDQHEDGQLTAFRERLAAEVRLRRNTIHDADGPGVYVYDQGLGILEDNDIAANAYAGVAIKTSGNPTLRRNRINRNEYQAIRVYKDGKGLVEDNDLTDNKRGAWSITTDSEGNVTRARNRE